MRGKQGKFQGLGHQKKFKVEFKGQYQIGKTEE